MYGQFKDIPENIKKKIEVLYGISYNDWLKLSHIINKSFEKKRGEADKHLQLSSEKDIFNPFYLASFTEPKKVLEYLNLIDNDLEQRKAHEVAKKIDSTGSTNLKTLAVATSSFASGLESIGKASMRLNGGSSPMMNRIAYNPSYGKILSSALIENEDSAVRKLILNVVSTVSNQAPALAYGLYTGGAGYGFALGNQVTSDSIAEAVQNNKTIESGFVYGLAQTALELSLEKLFGGIASKISGKGTSSFVSKMMNKIDDVVGNKKVASLIKKTLSLSETGAGEFLQEFTQAMTDPMLRNIIYNENNTYSAETLTDALYQGLIGFFAGGVMAAPTVKASVSNVQYTKIGEMSNAKNVLKLCEDVGYRHSDSYSEVKNSVEKGKTVDNATLGRLSVEVTQAIYDNTHFTEEYMATIANLGTTEQIAELMFGGNTEAAVKFKEKYSSRSVVDEGLSREYNESNVTSNENNDGGNINAGQGLLRNGSERTGRTGTDTESRSGTVQETNGGIYGDSQNNRVAGENSEGIRDSSNRRLTTDQKERLKSSVIKNDDGSPKAVYHFSENMEFEIFAYGDIGFHFGNIVQAERHSKGKSGRIIVAHLDIKNPVRFRSDLMFWSPRNTAFMLQVEGIISIEERLHIEKIADGEVINDVKEMYSSKSATELRRILAEKGYDGIVYQNMFEGDGESYIAFYPEQVIIINDGKGDDPSSSPTSQDENGESVFNISARGDRKDAVTRSIEKVTGHYSLNEHQKLLYEVGAQFGAKVRFANLDYVVEKEVKVRGADGRMQTVIKKITVSPEGQFDPDTNTITLNTNVKPYHRPVEYILKHEMTHSLEVDPESYNLFAKEVLGSEEFLRYAASKINPETEGTFGSADAWMQYIIKSYADKGASLGEGTEAQYKAKCEMVANFVGDMLFGGRGNISANLMAEISTEAKTGLLGWIQRFFEKVKQIFKGRPELTEIERLEQEFLKAARSVSKRNQNPAENKKTTTDEGDGVKYSIATDSAGKYVKVDTNQNIFDGKSVREMQEIARKLIRDNFRGKVLNVGEEGKAFVSKRSSDEYSYPANRRMNESLKESKMKAAPELDNLLSVSRFIEHQSDDGRHPQATGGWDVYSTRFEVGGTMFSGEVKIMVTDRGYLFHDITKIKRLPVNGGLTETSSAAASGNPSTDSITENGTPVNSNSMQQGVKYSLSDLDAEYMSAVEKGDTKTAQRLATKAAKDSGYTQRVLHGTSSFGFVKLDVSHSDDKTSFFATDSAETARTYSKGTGVRKVGPLTDADVLRIKDEVYQKAKDYAAFCNSKLSNKAETILDSINEKIEESIIALKNGKSFSEIRKDFVEFLGLLDEKFIEDYYHDNYEGKLSPEEFYALPETEKLDDDISKRSRHIIKALTALDPSNKTGLYEMFANTSNMLEVECNGANWDNIPKNAVPRVNSLKHLLYANRRTWTTRSLTGYAKSLGYSGVIFNNLVDSGNGTNVAPSTVYAFFNPQEQVKSADPVTYDDNGDVIPLSERFNRNNDDIRYSLPEVNIEKLTESQYNNFGWVRANDVIDASEYSTLLSRFADFKHGKDKYPVTRFGDAVIHSTECPDLLMYVKGTIRSPKISKIVSINKKDSTDISVIREEIILNEYERQLLPFSFVEEYYGKDVLVIHKARDYDSYWEIKSRLKRESGEKSNSAGRTEQNRGRGFAEDSPTGGKNVKYSLSAADHATLLDRYENGEITRAEYLEAIRPKKGTNPVKIANLSDEDADTTPSLPQPKGKGDGDGESKLYDSLLESTLITDEVKTEIANDTYIKNYGTTTNKAELQAAAERLEQGGKEEVDSWRVRGENVSAVDVAEGIILLKQYQDAGDISGAIVIAERLREIASLSGQAVQAFSIIGRFTPEMMVAYAKHELGKAREKMVALKTDEWLEANKSRFELTEEEIRMITDNTILASKLQDGSRTKAILLGEVTTLLQNKLPPERGQAMRAWVRTSLLFNPKTQLRNVLGNATMVMPYVGSDMFGGLIDKAIATKTGVRTTGFDAKIFGKSFAEGMKKGAQETIDDYKRKIHTKQEELDRFETNRGSGKSFNELHTGKLAKQLNAVARALNEVDRLNSMFLELGDRPFFEFWFANELNTLMKLNKTETPTKEMVEQAKQIALQRTWQDNNRVTKAASGLRKALNVASIGGYGLGDVVLKFVKTPANIAKAMVEFSPVGFAPAMFRIKELNRAIKKGSFTPAMQKEAVRSFSNAVVGTAVYLLGYALIAAGVLDISGDGDDDKDVSNFEKYVLGVPPYSFEFFGTRVTYTWNQPFGTVIATVAELMDETNKGTLDGWDVISTVGEVFTSQSFLQNLYEFFSKDDALTGLASLVISEPSATIPTLFSQMASLTDPYRRTAYQSGSPIKSALNDIIYRIPVLRQMFLPKQVNTLGEENKNPQFLNPWFAFIDPSTQYPKSSSMVAQNIYELYEKTGDKTVMPRVAPYKVTIKGKTVNFSIDERNEIQRQMGAVSAEILGEMFASAEFEKLSEEEQTKAVAKVYEYAYAKIKAGLDIYDYDTLSQIVGTKKNGDPILSAERYSRLNDKARQMLVDEYFFSDDEIKCKGTPKKLAELFIKKIKK